MHVAQMSNTNFLRDSPCNTAFVKQKTKNKNKTRICWYYQAFCLIYHYHITDSIQKEWPERIKKVSKYYITVYA